MAKAERMKGFAVTYEIITHESAEQGDYDEAGYILESCTLREAVEAIGGAAWGEECSGDFFTNYEYRTEDETGSWELRSLHVPDSITAASHGRIARLLGR